FHNWALFQGAWVACPDTGQLAASRGLGTAPSSRGQLAPALTACVWVQTGSGRRAGGQTVLEEGVCSGLAHSAPLIMPASVS
uniref:Uncharacterized protein n=1 Tax=Mustela putorius furo TaxID=9669 RepID=M3Y164_MUSPF